MKNKHKKRALIKKIAKTAPNTQFSAVYNNEETLMYVLYLTYKVEFALYEICKQQQSPDLWALTWQEYLDSFSRSKELIQMAREIIQEAIFTFPSSSFDFKIIVIDKKGVPEDGMLHMVELFSGAEGNHLIETLTLRAELAHFSFVEKQHENGYSWKQYMFDLQNVSMAILLCLQTLPFEELWEKKLSA